MQGPSTANPLFHSWLHAQGLLLVAETRMINSIEAISLFSYNIVLHTESVCTAYCSPKRRVLAAECSHSLNALDLMQT